MRERVVDRKLLTPAECEKARAAVLRMRKHWVPAAPSDPKDLARPHFHLGAWSFKGTKRGFRDYLACGASCNPVLRGQLGWMYDALAEALSDFLRAPVGYDDRLGLPGFNIFLPAAGRAEAIGQPHFDRVAFKELGWPAPRRPDKEFITYIMPVAMPRSGSGLDYWDLDAEEYEKLSPARKAFELSCSQRFHPYELGALSIQLGSVYHRAAGTNEFKRGEVRITLQGHGAKRKGRWTLYL